MKKVTAVGLGVFTLLVSLFFLLPSCASRSYTEELSPEQCPVGAHLIPNEKQCRWNTFSCPWTYFPVKTRDSYFCAQTHKGPGTGAVSPYPRYLGLEEDLVRHNIGNKGRLVR